MLIEVMTQLSADTGIHLEQKRPTLIELLNKGGRELHKQVECLKINREVTLVVAPNKIVSLPQFIGELRGTRISCWDEPFDVHAGIRPRYVTNTLGYKYKNWRDLGELPFHTTPTITGVISLIATGVESTPVIVKINGESDKAAQVEEEITMSAVEADGITVFTPNIRSITCATKGRIYNIVVYDENETEIAILYNNQARTRYKIIDVSQLCWPTNDTAAGESLVDVMYKVPYELLFNDSDSFPAGDDYDEAWYNMCMYYHFSPMENRINQALAHRAAAIDFCRSAKESGEQGVMKKISFGRSKYHGYFNQCCPDSYNYRIN